MDESLLPVEALDLASPFALRMSHVAYERVMSHVCMSHDVTLRSTTSHVGYE